MHVPLRKDTVESSFNVQAFLFLLRKSKMENPQIRVESNKTRPSGMPVPQMDSAYLAPV